MPVPPCDISRGEFCTFQNIPLETYLKLKQHKAAPEEYRVPGTKLERITPAAYRAWLTMSKQPGSKAAEILYKAIAARRRGLLSLKSPNHPMNLLNARGHSESESVYCVARPTAARGCVCLARTSP